MLVLHIQYNILYDRYTILLDSHRDLCSMYLYDDYVVVRKNYHLMEYLYLPIGTLHTLQSTRRYVREGKKKSRYNKKLKATRGSFSLHGIGGLYGT